MKLRLPSLLLAAIVALQLGSTAKADYVGNGVYYDNGKQTFSHDPSLYNSKDEYIGKADSEYCWANTGANLVQYWQNTYISRADNEAGTPNGISSSYSQPYGTSYLDIYQETLKHGVSDETSYIRDFFDWWFRGGAVVDGGRTVLDNHAGYYTNEYTANQATYIKWDGDTLDSFTQYVKDAFNTQGVGVGLHIVGMNTDGTWGLGHAVTCWGYEENDGVITSLLLADSDDEFFGVFRVNLSADPTGIIFIDTDDQSSYYGPEDHMIMLMGAENINTLNGQTATPAATSISTPTSATRYDVSSNTRLTSNQTIDTGKGVTVGNGTNIVVLTSESNSAELVLKGNQNQTTGLEVKAGSLVSLDKLTVEDYGDGGMKLDGHAYLHDGSLRFAGNTTTNNGGGILNNSYLSIENNDTVSFTENHADGNGGAIYNTDGKTLSIRHNGTVSFSGNTASQGGNDIFNGAGSFLNIVYNKDISFTGSDVQQAAIVNRGEAHFGVSKDQTFTLTNASLDSMGGTTHIGSDLNKGEYYDVENYEQPFPLQNHDLTGSVDFESEGHRVSIKGQIDGSTVAAEVPVVTPAALKNLIVNAEEIAGVTNNLWARESSISNASIAAVGMLTMRNVALDSTDGITTATGGDSLVTFDNVIITLASTDEQTSGTYDLTGMFSGNFKIKSLYFDVTGLGETVDPTSITINLGDGLNVTDIENTALWLGNNMISPEANFSGGLVTFSAETLEIPEPTTGTLGLLALAGLCGRRRRR